MKKLTVIITLTFISLFSYSQKKLTTKDTLPKTKDTTVLIVFTVKDFSNFISWFDNLNIPHQEVKSMQKFIYDRIKILK